jgi:hypothetical protein
VTAEEVRERVLQSGGVLTVTMDQLLEMISATYMSKHAPARIQEELNQVELDHVPRLLPQERWALVRLFDPRSRAGELIRAVLDANEVSDELIRRVAASLSAEASSTLAAATSTGITHERIVDAVASIEPISGQPAFRVAAAQVQEVVARLADDPELRSTLRSEGVRLQAVGKGVRHALPDLDTNAYGFSTLREFLQCTLVGTDYAVAMRAAERPHGRLVERRQLPDSYELLPDVSPRATTDSTNVTRRAVRR